ncbi:hypothetical protein NADFUDRAFT_84576 [Nadsonia fulvescens var. elongata DSM 6958]|uniref:ABC transporter domain-containing protein n=1 Tax=Nadsonia fulvescens var. elongata DSM 6958 TaxID=857566 RepID=A0A1E3PCK6_9ASCO|nr:hypothetical protein NADFUDRAFT_84576 [Nadsonia fulvescens var. elongata DSM 6958]
MSLQRSRTKLATRAVSWYLSKRSIIIPLVYAALFFNLFRKAIIGGSSNNNDKKSNKTKTSQNESSDEEKSQKPVLSSISAKKKTPTTKATTSATPTTTPITKPKVAVDKVFVKRLVKIIQLVIYNRPKILKYLSFHTIFLVFRSLLSLYVASLDGRLVSLLVKGEGKEFLLGIVWWMVVSVPATFTNSMLNYLSREISKEVRIGVTKVVMDQYIPVPSQQVIEKTPLTITSTITAEISEGNPDSSSRTISLSPSSLTEKQKKVKMYYALRNLDDRIHNADQLLTVDIFNFAKSLTNLYSNLAKPTFDMFLYSWKLSHSIGAEGMLAVGILVQLSGSFLKFVTPPFGKYVAREAELEGTFRFEHSRLLEYSEEIAFHAGEDTERGNLDRAYFTLVKHVNQILRRRLVHSVFEDFVVKYFWGALGLALCSMSIFFEMPGLENLAGQDRTQLFIMNRRLLLSASDAFGRILSSYKDISQLSGFTSRISGLLDVMGDISNGHFVKTLVSSGESRSKTLLDLNKYGEIIQGRPDINFVNVPIVSPNGDVLVPSLTCRVPHGRHLLIIGPNGCGKSSLFRILGGLWPVFQGSDAEIPTIVEKPYAKEIFYIPQRAYLSKGTLRQQIIYPDVDPEDEAVKDDRAHLSLQALKATDEEIVGMMAIVGIDHLANVYSNGLSEVREWKEELSTGLQQRIAMARLFYHRPKYAILDECTSTMPLELETASYNHAKQLGISLLTVSHRRSLWQYHDLVLEFDGEGGYVFLEMDPEKRLNLVQEKEGLDKKLQLVGEWEEKLAMLKGIVEESTLSLSLEPPLSQSLEPTT